MIKRSKFNTEVNELKDALITVQQTGKVPKSISKLLNKQKLKRSLSVEEKRKHAANI